MVGTSRRVAPAIATSETRQGCWCLKIMSCFFAPSVTVDFIGRRGLAAIKERMVRCSPRYFYYLTTLFATMSYWCSWIHWLTFSFRLPQYFIKVGWAANKENLECWTPRRMKLHREMNGQMKRQRWERMVCSQMRSGQKRIRFLQIKTYSRNLHFFPS